MADLQRHSLGNERMNALERRTGFSLAAIFALRMLGLFLILPIFSVYAAQLPGGQNAAWTGFAFGAFGLTQALLHIPYGMASDRFGRKRVITVGLLFFVAGSIIAAFAPNIYWMALGRSVQGAGAVSAAVTALAADLSRPEQRTKIMAIIGSSIGLVFAFSLVAAPLLYHAIGMAGVFFCIGALALIAIPFLWYVVPDPPAPGAAPLDRAPFKEVLRNPELMRMNFGVFVLHLIQMAMFMAIPHALVDYGNLPLARHWQVYLPVVLASFVVLVPAIVASERKGRTKLLFVVSVALLGATQALLIPGHEALWSTVLLLFLFFSGFNFLEASQPSLVSRYAPANARGAALGLYNVSQSLGVACGSLTGGVLIQMYGMSAVFAVCAGLTMIWLYVALSMQPPVSSKQRAAAAMGLQGGCGRQEELEMRQLTKGEA